MAAAAGGNRPCHTLLFGLFSEKKNTLCFFFVIEEFRVRFGLVCE
jgi:hypothetical protein